MTVYWPALDPRVTEEAGTRGGTHYGLDLAARKGDPVLAAFDGVAVFVGGDGASGRIQIGPKQYAYANGQGKTVDIRRSDGLISRVGHMSGYVVKQGQKVNAGQVIGYAGMTGFALGVHIHWELRWDRAWAGGRWINPRSVKPEVFSDDLGGIMGFYKSKKDFRDDLMHMVVNAPMNSGLRDGDGEHIREPLGASVRRGHQIGRQNRIKADRIEGKVDALGIAIQQLSGGKIDMAAIEKAAFEGAAQGAKDVDAKEIAEMLQISVKDE